MRVESNKYIHYDVLRRNMAKVAWFLFAFVFIAMMLPNYPIISAKIQGFDWHTNSSIVNFFNGIIYISTHSVEFLVVIVFEVFLLAVCARPWLWMLINSIFLIWLPFELFYIIQYGTSSNVHILSILTETNFDEIYGYAGEWLVFGGLFYIIWILFIIYITIFLYKNINPWFHRTRLWVAISLLFILMIVGLKLWISNEEVVGHKSAPDVGCLAGDCRQAPMFRIFLNTYPFGMPLRVVSYFQQENILSIYAKNLHKNRVSIARLKSMHDLKETYIFVIGESSRADRWQLLGYKRETTPNSFNISGLIPFGNVISATVATRTSVPIMLSETRVGDLKNFDFKASWIPTFQDAGFHVTWLSVQQPIGTHDTTVGMYAALANETHYLNASSYGGRGSFDGDLLLPLSKALAMQHKKKLIILHTLGSHAPYENRYPKNFEHFKPSLSSSSQFGLLSSEKNRLIDNSYDNTIRYTDEVLGKVISQLKDAAGVSALWYLSDHGQTLPSDGCKNTGNGFISKSNLIVPMIFWHNLEYEKLLPIKVKSMKNNRSKDFSSGSFRFTILDSLGFMLSDADLSHSIASDSYKEARRDITIDGVKIFDFDSLSWLGVCAGSDDLFQ